MNKIKYWASNERKASRISFDVAQNVSTKLTFLYLTKNLCCHILDGDKHLVFEKEHPTNWRSKSEAHGTSQRTGITLSFSQYLEFLVENYSLDSRS